MAEPKKKLTSLRSGNRRSHNALKQNSLILCSNCKSKIKPHTVCLNCGFYRGKKVIQIKQEKYEKKKQEEEFKNE
jgi:large subunit ribosomal protein L32